MADFIYGPDRLYAPIELTSDNNQIVMFDPGEERIVVTISPGTYYNHLDGSGSTGALLKAIEDGINAIVPGEKYSIHSRTPTGSSLTNSGIEFRQSSTDGIELTFSDPDFTLDPRLLGWHEDQSTDVSDEAELQSPYSLWGVWQSWNIADNAASDKTSFPFQNIALSSDNIEQAARKKYLTKKPRTLRYDYVPGGHIFEHRAEDLASSNTAELPQGDVHNSIISWWRLATAPGDDDRMAKIIILHDKGEEGYEAVFGDHYETARMSDEDQINRTDEFLDRLLMGGEYYRIEIEFDIIDGTYDQ